LQKNQLIYESFFLGKPVIGSALGGIPELIDDGINGLLYSPGNENELSEKIDELLSNEVLVKKYGLAAREKAEKQFSPDYHYEEMMTLYKSIS